MENSVSSCVLSIRVENSNQMYFQSELERVIVYFQLESKTLIMYFQSEWKK